MATAAAADLGGAARASGPGDPVRPCGVGAMQLCSAGLLVEGGVAAARVPARLTEVAHATVCCCRQRSVIAAAVEDEGGAADRSHIVWLLVVDDGEEALRQYLRAFSALGAMRADFWDEYAVSAEPFCSGGSAALYKASYGCGSTQPAELAAKVKVLECSADFSKVESEAAFLRMVQGHPNIIRLHGQFLCLAGEPEEGAESQVGEQGAGGARKYVSPLPVAQPCHVLITDLCPKGDLDDRVTAKGPYSEANGLQLIVGLLSALAHVHGIGLVHRDVKSQNVLLGTEGRPLLADFGSTARLSDAEAMKGIAGTLGYAAPEIYLGVPYGEQVDVFGAGVVLYFALLARLPFAEGQSRETVAESTVQCCVRFPSCAALSMEAKQLVRSLLTREPIHRPSARTAVEAAKRLQPQQRRGAEPQALQALKPLQSQQLGRAERPAFKKDSWKVAPEKAGRRGNDCEVLSNQSTKAPSSLFNSESTERPALEENSWKVAPLEKAGRRHSGHKDCEALSNQPTQVPISPVMLGTSEPPALEVGSREVQPDSARRPSMNSAYELLSSHSMASSASRTRFRVCHVGSCQKADRCHSGDTDCEALSDQSTKVAMSSVIAGTVERPALNEDSRRPSENEVYELLSNASTASLASQGRFRVCQVGSRRKDQSQEEDARSRATSQPSLDATKLSVGKPGSCLARREVPLGRRVLTDIKSSLSRCQLQLQKMAL